MSQLTDPMTDTDVAILLDGQHQARSAGYLHARNTFNGQFGHGRNGSSPQ